MGRTKGVPARVAPPSGAEDGVWTVLSRARPGAGDDDSSSRGSCALVADASASAASDDDHGPQPNGGSRTLAAAAPASDSPHGPRPNRLYPRTGKRGAPQAFPRKVYEILSEQPPAIVSWNTSGRSFSIHDMGRFVSVVLQKYFAHQKFSSFQRQLNLYGFKRIEPGAGEPAGSYCHESFRRGREELLGGVRRPKQHKRDARAVHGDGASDGDEGGGDGGSGERGHKRLRRALAAHRGSGRQHRACAAAASSRGGDTRTRAADRDSIYDDVDVLRALAASRAADGGSGCARAGLAATVTPPIPSAVPIPPMPLARAPGSLGVERLGSAAVVSDAWFPTPSADCPSAAGARSTELDALLSLKGSPPITAGSPAHSSRRCEV